MTIGDTGEMISMMAPVLVPMSYCFCSIGVNLDQVRLEDILGSFQEPEGTSLIVEAGRAKELGLNRSAPMSMIQLMVHSSIEGVGLTAAVAGRLADHHIACNVVAAFHHDYLFVPESDAERALTLLLDLQANASP
jgi:hypothetical protein